MENESNHVQAFEIRLWKAIALVLFVVAAFLFFQKSSTDSTYFIFQQKIGDAGPVYRLNKYTGEIVHFYSGASDLTPRILLPPGPANPPK